MFTFCCGSDVFLFLVLLQDGSNLLLSLRLYLVTEDSVETSRLSDIARDCLCTVFHCTFCDAHAPGDTIGSLRCDHWFSLWAFPVKKTQMRLL